MPKIKVCGYCEQPSEDIHQYSDQIGSYVCDDCYRELENQREYKIKDI